MTAATTRKRDRVPLELRERPNWVCWRSEERDGNATKVPYRADGLGLASTTDPATWTSFETAVGAIATLHMDGVGYVFSADDPYSGIDLDAALSQDERDWIMTTLDSYSECSVSGNGVHVIVRASLNGYPRNRKGPFEVYDAGRYFVVTGEHVEGTPTTIEPRQDQLDRVLTRFLPKREPVERPAMQPVSLDDRALLDRAEAARHGNDFAALYRGAWEGRYGSHSEADLALCRKLAFWTGRDGERMDRLFRASGLMRDKWDRTDYRQRTIETAIAGCDEVYSPTRSANATAAIAAVPEAARASEADVRGEALHTDMANAVLFAAMHGGRLRHIRERRSWYAWEDGRWRRDTTGHAQRAAKETARELWRRAFGDDEATRWAIRSQQEPRLRAMLELAASEPSLALAADDLDRDPFLLACGNGTLDLRTGALRPHDSADLISLGTEIEFDPEATCLRWAQFLLEVFDGDVALVAYLRRAIGYMLTGDGREHVVFVFHGAGCNGKSTLVETIKRLLGDLADTAPFESFTRARADRSPRNDIARLHRSRLVIASESGTGHKLDEAIVKNLSGSDTIAARFLYGEFFEFRPQFKIVLVSNHKPQVDGNDDAIWRRIRLIPFLVSFEGREDRDLTDKLQAELAGILNWAVQGCLEWQQRGLGKVATVTEATREYRAEEDTLGAFIEERCVLHGTVITADLREAYETYCDSLGEKPLAFNTLSRQLRKRGITPKPGRKRTYEGLSLRDDGSEHDDDKRAVSVTPLTCAGERGVTETTVINRQPSSTAADENTPEGRPTSPEEGTTTGEQVDARVTLTCKKCGDAFRFGDLGTSRVECRSCATEERRVAVAAARAEVGPDPLEDIVARLEL